jgi:hypothetical protein
MKLGPRRKQLAELRVLLCLNISKRITNFSTLSSNYILEQPPLQSPACFETTTITTLSHCKQKQNRFYEIDGKLMPRSSPQGRIFQVEYAQEAVKQGSVVVGIVSKTHAVLAALKVHYESIVLVLIKLLNSDNSETRKSSPPTSARSSPSTPTMALPSPVWPAMPASSPTL